MQSCNHWGAFLQNEVRQDRGAEEGGLPGLLGGAVRALLSLVIRPVAWLLATSAAVADSVRTTVTGAAAALPRLRPPRPVPPGLPLPPYDWSEVLPPHPGPG